MKSYHLASPQKRLEARIIDGAVLFVIYRVVLYVISLGFGAVLVLPAIHMISNVTAMAVFFLLNYRFLATDGQSIGKRVLKLRIVSMDNRIPSIWKSFVIRELALMNPTVGGSFVE